MQIGIDYSGIDYSAQMSSVISFDTMINRLIRKTAEVSHEYNVFKV